VEHEECNGGVRNYYEILASKPEGEKPSHRWEGNAVDKQDVMTFTTVTWLHTLSTAGLM
jgi:hypothetical protein